MQIRYESPGCCFFLFIWQRSKFDMNHPFFFFLIRVFNSSFFDKIIKSLFSFHFFTMQTALPRHCPSLGIVHLQSWLRKLRHHPNNNHWPIRRNSIDNLYSKIASAMVPPLANQTQLSCFFPAADFFFSSPPVGGATPDLGMTAGGPLSNIGGGGGTNSWNVTSWLPIDLCAGRSVAYVNPGGGGPLVPGWMWGTMKVVLPPAEDAAVGGGGGGTHMCCSSPASLEKFIWKLEKFGCCCCWGQYQHIDQSCQNISMGLLHLTFHKIYT